RSRAVGMVPIHERVVEADAQTLSTRSLDVFLDEIPPRTPFRRAIICRLRIEEAKTLVMLRRHHHVLHPSALRQLGPVAGRIRLGTEELCGLLVLGGWNAFHLHDPFMTSIHAVHTPVNEHSEFCRVPPSHASFAIAIGCGPRCLSCLPDSDSGI